MALKKLPPLRHDMVIIDVKTGRLTEQGLRWFTTLYFKTGQAGEIPTESLIANAKRNFSNNAVAEWVDVDAAAGLVKVHGPLSDTDDWERYEGIAADPGYQLVGTFPAFSISKPYNATYYIAFNPATQVYVVTTDYRETLREGLFWVGNVRANDSFGGTGAVSGGGGSADGTTGGTIEVSPGIRIGGGGMLY